MNKGQIKVRKKGIGIRFIIVVFKMRILGLHDVCVRCSRNTKTSVTVSVCVCI